jgi:dipeptidyl aminopeptidase
VGLVVLAAIIGVIAGSVYTGTPYHSRGVRRITMDHIFNGTFDPEKRSLHWVPEGYLPAVVLRFD